MELGFLAETDERTPSSDGLTARKLDHLVSYQPRPFSSLEVEVTTRCNLYCPSCPRVRLGSTWINQDMTLACFEKAAASLDRFETVHFRGWGEPLLNPCFPEMVRLAYQSGARLVLTTNGQQMPDLGLLPYFKAILFRLDYGRAATYERRNPGSGFNRVIFNISQVLHARDSIGSAHPQIILLFAKNKYSLRELPAYLETAIRLQPDRVGFYQPFFHVRRIDSSGELPADLDPGLIQTVDARLEAMARAAGLDMVNQPVLFSQEKDRRPRCPLTPTTSLFLSWRGHLAGCRFSTLPVIHGTYTQIVGGRARSRANVIFGSLRRNSLDSLVEHQKRWEFRQTCHQTGWCLDPEDHGTGHPARPGSVRSKRRGNLIFLGHGSAKSDFGSKR